MINAENKKQIAILLCAIGLGFIATWATSQYVENKITKQAEFLAKEAQKKNAAIVNDLELMKRELSKVRSQQEALARQQAELKLHPPKQAVQEAKKAAPAEAMAFSLKTPYGKRALTIMIDSLSAVGGLITASDFVDILAHFTINDNSAVVGKAPSSKTTSILFQNVQVLAVGTRYTQAPQPAAPQGDALGYEAQQKTRSLYVTLAVTPEEAGLLTFVQASGSLQLILRSPQEDTTQILQVASWDALAEFVLEHQGTELSVPGKRVITPSSNVEIEEAPTEDEVKPFIQIFKRGRELNL